jgi:hypothetical protein
VDAVETSEKVDAVDDVIMIIESWLLDEPNGIFNEQLLLHESAFMKFPSSHSSCIRSKLTNCPLSKISLFTMPSPQTGHVHPCHWRPGIVERQRGILGLHAHSALEPGGPFRNPRSHSSPGFIIPFPHSDRLSELCASELKKEDTELPKEKATSDVLELCSETVEEKPEDVGRSDERALERFEVSTEP